MVFSIKKQGFPVSHGLGLQGEAPSDTMDFSVLYNLFFQGALVKGGDWGGPICRSKSVSSETRILETAMWLAFSISVYLLLDVPGVVSWMHKTATKELEHQGAISSSMDGEDALPRPVVGKKGRWSMYEKALAAVHFFMFVQLVYWKFRDNVLIMLTQPCHILLFLQGVALLWHESGTANYCLAASHSVWLVTCHDCSRDVWFEHNRGTGLLDPALANPGRPGLPLVQAELCGAQGLQSQVYNSRYLDLPNCPLDILRLG